MSRKYKFYDSKKPHFVSFAIVNWIDLFTRKDYVDIVTESMSYCIQEKGLILNAWCIMTNHVHLMIRSEQNLLSDIMRDLKKFTSYKLYSTIQEHPQESRKEWLLWMFEQSGQANENNKNIQVWQQHNQPIELDTNEKIDQRLEYLHMNPVKAGYVIKPEDWVHSSARQYAGLEDRFDLELIE
ncbi:MAG: transposase [Balneolaceae bacterium]|nr:transposase [Balneolaceae bacterium]